MFYLEGIVIKVIKVFGFLCILRKLGFYVFKETVPLPFTAISCHMESVYVDQTARALLCSFGEITDLCETFFSILFSISSVHEMLDNLNLGLSNGEN